MQKDLSIIIMAAGKSSRMPAKKTKPLQNLCGKTLLEHITATAQALQPKQLCVVYRHNIESFKNTLTDNDVTWIQQGQEAGTGAAAKAVLPHITAKQTLFLCADTPLVTIELLQQLLKSSENSVGLITATTSTPYGLGRIVRDCNNNLVKIVEQKDASLEEQNIKEISSGIITAPTKFLQQAIPKLNNNNQQQEFYLPEIIPMWLQLNKNVITIQSSNYATVMGINTFAELANAEKIMQQKITHELMQQGVRIHNPETLCCLGEVNTQAGVTIESNVTFRGKVFIETGAYIEANCILEDCSIGKDAVIKANSIVTSSIIRNNASIGPFAYIRPKCDIQQQAKIGAFVETKAITMGRNSKANHLSYLGDCTIGENVNIGAATITCNYDGFNKHKTTICDNSFVGSGCQLIAPVTINESSYIAAGSCITEDTPAQKLTIARAKQISINSKKSSCEES